MARNLATTYTARYTAICRSVPFGIVLVRVRVRCRSYDTHSRPSRAAAVLAAPDFTRSWYFACVFMSTHTDCPAVFQVEEACHGPSVLELSLLAQAVRACEASLNRPTNDRHLAHDCLRAMLQRALSSEERPTQGANRAEESVLCLGSGENRKRLGATPQLRR